MKSKITKTLELLGIPYKKENEDLITIIHSFGGGNVYEKIYIVDSFLETAVYLKYYCGTRTVCKLISIDEAIEQIRNTDRGMRN